MLYTWRGNRCRCVQIVSLKKTQLNDFSLQTLSTGEFFVSCWEYNQWYDDLISGVLRHKQIESNKNCEIIVCYHASPINKQE